MPTINISLPEILKAFVDSQIAEGPYASVSDYIRTLIREDLRRQEEERLEQALLAALDRGSFQDVTPESWDRLRARLALTRLRQDDAKLSLHGKRLRAGWNEPYTAKILFESPLSTTPSSTPKTSHIRKS